jgi:hypothetical protein
LPIAFIGLPCPKNNAGIGDADISVLSSGMRRDYAIACTKNPGAAV